MEATSPTRHQAQHPTDSDDSDPSFAIMFTVVALVTVAAIILSIVLAILLPILPLFAVVLIGISIPITFAPILAFGGFIIKNAVAACLSDD